jgi:hypothetical protein
MGGMRRIVWADREARARHEAARLAEYAATQARWLAEWELENRSVEYFADAYEWAMGRQEREAWRRWEIYYLWGTALED